MSEKDELRTHNFDGIQEYDNDLPRWWLGLFALTVLFSAVYPLYYDFGPGQFASESVDAEVAAIRASQESARPKSVGVTEESLLKLASDTTALQKGQGVYVGKCLACHGDKGQGIVGPNLTDDFWIHGGKITDVHRIVMEGVLEKGMLAWKDQLAPEDLQAVVAYVWSLHGTNPPNAKAPQGEKVVR